MKNIASVLGILLMAACSNACAGFTFTSVTKADGDDHAAKMQSMTLKGSVMAAQGRFDIAHSGNPIVPAGCYLLTKDGGQSIQVVDPKAKTYRDLDLKGLAALAQGVANMTFSSPKVTKVLDEDGEKILGYPTRHQKIQTSYTISMAAMGQSFTVATTKEEELWVCQKFHDIALRAFDKLGEMKTGNPIIDALVAVEKSKTTGLPLKSIVTTTSKNSATNQTTTSRVVTEITDLKEANVDPSIFQIPADYKEDTSIKELPKSLTPQAGAHKAATPKPKKPAKNED